MKKINRTKKRFYPRCIKVFENKTKSLLSERSETMKMAQGGAVEDKIYSPYEFLHELLPKVYGRPYVVSDEVGKQYNEQIEKEQNILRFAK
jgi:hypothetical protein